MSGSKVDLSEFLPPYLAEVEELLVLARKSLLAAEAAAKGGGHNALAVRELFRAVHTIKGLSSMIDLEPIVAISHEMESCLRAADKAGGHLEANAVEPLLAGLRSIDERVNALATSRKVSPAPQGLLDTLRDLDKPRARPGQKSGAVTYALDPEIDAKVTASERTQLLTAMAAGRRAIRLEFSPSPAKANDGLTINSIRDRLRAIGELVKVAPVHAPKTEASPAGLLFLILFITDAPDEVVSKACGCAVIGELGRAVVPAPPRPDALPELPPDAMADDEQSTSEEGRSSAVVRVPSERLDDALERVSAMFVGRSKLHRAAASLTAKGVDTRELNQLLAEHSRHLRDLRSSFLRLRMVPVSQVLQGLPLVMRGLKRTTGKNVELQLETGRAEVDKAVGDRLIPAIVHLARNAVDHAIETPEQRKRLGKPEEGTVRVTGHDRSSTQLELTVSDDGRGIDAVAVAARAGVPVPQTTAALLELLCRPGLSTRTAADTTSGRGMGMDIVKRIVDQLGGELTLTTEPDRGTSFVLRLPLSITIVDALVFEVAGHRYAVPLSSVEELVEVDAAKVVTGPAPRAGGLATGLMERRGFAMPIVGLNAAMGLAQQALGSKALVIRQGDEPVAFAVDRMMGQQEIVVRPLDDLLVKVAGISGAADLGDGRPTLVLDLLALGAAVLQRTQQERRS